MKRYEKMTKKELADYVNYLSEEIEDEPNNDTDMADEKDEKDEKDEIITRPIGEVFEYNDNGKVIKLEVANSIGCQKCYFFSSNYMCRRTREITGFCGFRIFKKVDEPRFKIGDWVYDAYNEVYFIVEDISKKGNRILAICSETDYEHELENLVPARKRPWTIDDMPKFRGQWFKYDVENVDNVQNYEMIGSYSSDKEDIQLNHTPIDFFKNAKFLDISDPWGFVFEHLEKGEWVE